MILRQFQDQDQIPESELRSSEDQDKKIELDLLGRGHESYNNSAWRISLCQSDGVHGHVDLEAHLGVREDRPDVVLEEVPDAVELHDVGGLLAQPELVELHEEVAVQVVEVW